MCAPCDKVILDMQRYADSQSFAALWNGEKMKEANRILAEKMLREKPMKCAECGAEMQYLGRGEYRCDACGNIQLDDFGKVRKYLDEHGPTSYFEISQATGVRRSVIKEMLLESRLELREQAGSFLRCEKCGCTLKSGRFCPDCYNQLNGEMKKVYSVEAMGEKTGENGRMRFVTKPK